MSLYLGFDSSTQSLTAIVIELSASGERRVVLEHSLRFDEDFPEFGTVNGVLPRSDPLVAHSSPLLWVAALDRMMEFLSREADIDVRAIRAISGSGQQHGSVYLRAEADSVLRRLEPRRSLTEQMKSLFSRPTSPIWMDSSTSRQCREITETIGGAQRLAELTGSHAFERFTGPQIRKFWQDEPAAYEETDRVHLVSSFLASVLAGRHAPIDHGDGAGMNLMDIAAKEWAPKALHATAPGLAAKLPPLAPSWTIVGGLAPYFVERYGFSPETHVVAWSGDNPCSLIGVGLAKPGRIAISLGTSDTLFGYMSEPRVDPAGGGHVFGSPTGDYMSLICFKNGSLAREAIRRQHGLDWEGFSAALRETAPGNEGRILLPWFEPEITPAVHDARVRRYGGLDEGDAPANVRAVVEAQMMSTHIHSLWMGMKVKTIYATGGAARNRDILRVMADVHGAIVYQFLIGNSAGLGAALRAFHADRVAGGEVVNWDDVTKGFAEPLHESRIEPNRENVCRYREMESVYRACEAHAIRGGDDPQPLVERFCASLT